MASRKELVQRNIDKPKAIIISGFAAIGKSTFAKDPKVREIIKNNKMNIIDLDSSLYSKDKRPGIFPGNYEAAIRKAAEQPCIILISTHPGLATRLADQGYYVAIVYPGGGLDAKNEWLSRLGKREKGGQKSPLYQLVEKYWKVWFEGNAKEQVTKRLTLPNNKYLVDVFGSIYEDFLKKRSLK